MIRFYKEKQRKTGLAMNWKKSSSNGQNPGNADKWAFPGLLYVVWL